MDRLLRRCPQGKMPAPVPACGFQAPKIPVWARAYPEAKSRTEREKTAVRWGTVSALAIVFGTFRHPLKNGNTGTDCWLRLPYRRSSKERSAKEQVPAPAWRSSAFRRSFWEEALRTECQPAQAPHNCAKSTVQKHLEREQTAFGAKGREKRLGRCRQRAPIPRSQAALYKNAARSFPFSGTAKARFFQS